MGRFILTADTRAAQDRRRRQAYATGAARGAARRARSAGGGKREAGRAFDAAMSAHGYARLGR